jgi:uncharacterized protein YkwD
MRLVIGILVAGCGSSTKPPASEAVPASDPPSSSDGWTKPVDSESEKIPAPAPAAAARKPAGAPKLDATAQAFFDAHNRARAKHCAPPLAWSATLATVAQSWANELAAKGCTFGHSPGRNYGENLAAGTIGALDPESTVAMWYDEIKLYKFPDGGFSMQTGHFTQVVWTTTTQVGCGHVQCKGNDIFVCNYDPPGNWKGQYKQHVLPASCKK